MKNKLIALFVACLCTALVSTHAAAAEKRRLAYAVICADAALAAKLDDGIRQRLGQAGVEVSEAVPQGKLFLYASRDVNDRKNKSGVSFAIAHVSNVQTALLGLEALKRKEPLGEPLASMLKEPGFLQHLNVAHIDEASDAQLKTMLDTVVSTFLSKYPAASGG